MLGKRVLTLVKTREIKGKTFNQFKLILVGFFVTLLVGCSGIPYAVIDGSRAKITDVNTYPVYISGIDGKLYFERHFVRNIEPGKHQVRLTTTKPAKSGGSMKESITIEIDFKPCKRYLIQARHDKNKQFSNRYWKPEIIRLEDVGGCKVEDGQTEVQLQSSKVADNAKVISL